MTAAAMVNLWADDVRVLTAIVRATEIDGQDFPDMPAIYAELGIDPEVGGRSIRRLRDADMVITDGSGRRGGMGGRWIVTGVTERGLRHAGAWPDDATRLAEQIIAALAEAAENEPEPERRGRLQRAAGGVAGVGRDVFAEVLAAVIARSAGLG